jgi:hypothetical protein
MPGALKRRFGLGGEYSAEESGREAYGDPLLALDDPHVVHEHLDAFVGSLGNLSLAR